MEIAESNSELFFWCQNTHAIW